MPDNQSTAAAGLLYIVATPIGNLQDMTARATEVLASVDAIAAEDSRHSARLLQHLGIATPVFSLHEHNENAIIPKVLERLGRGQNIALISDAGTPLISDPGYQLVRAAHQAGLRVSPVPGACALTAALCSAGLPSDRFIFEGFLPHKSAARKAALEGLATESRTLIFYEAPHRILASLQDMLSVFGAGRHVVLARELTKTFETIRGGNLAELLQWVAEDPNQQKGEFVVLVRGSEKKQTELDAASLHVLKTLQNELPLKQAAALTARITGLSKKLLYQAGLDAKSEQEV